MPLSRSSAVSALALTLLSGCTTDRATSPVTRIPTDAALGAEPSDPTPGTIALEKIGQYAGAGAAAAEITAFDHVSKRLFVVNGALGTVDVLDLRVPSTPVLVSSIAVGQFGAGANSVAAHNGVVAIAIEGATRTAPGTVAFYRSGSLELISSVTVGSLPDMVTFTPDGRTVLVANEGEPDASYQVDPEGSVSIIDVRNVRKPSVRTASFTAWNGQEGALRASGIRIFGPNASAAQDFEPEYIAVTPDGRRAWVTLQENNAMALIDIEGAYVRRIVPLGYKDHNVVGQGMDASDRDNAVNIRPWPVYGMYQPDAVASYKAANGQTYLVTANEGDARDYAGFQEETRVGSNLNAAIFTSALCNGSCTGNANLGRLTVTKTLGLDPVTGQFNALYAFGTRSFSIWNADGLLVWDSGDDFEQRTQALASVAFNASNSGNSFDDRSDNKGPEPEGVALGTLGKKTFAFIGLERVGGIMVYDVTQPTAPQFVTYINTRTGATGDLGPEGIIFVPAVRSPTKSPLVIVGNEVSGTTAIFRVVLQ
ncbi:MAG TPA: choice-of-anchor I family protein [Gemmatimonadaceae bacterium]|nr:choice-of-anchor I family protein [Gemmatimonadaceae bacterium]HPV74369.1 choice-of-anchor I family protein [Gemmatimonadaceae bacterium]